jgi:hypothetical protein
MEELQQVKFNNELILTTDQLAEFYGTTTARIKQNFNANKDKFIEGKHFYFLEGAVLRQFKNEVGNYDLVGKNASALMLWTKRGASRHSKMLGTDRAWDMYDRLEENYFSQEQKVLNVSKLSPELQMFKGLFDSVASQELKTKQLENHQNETDKKLDSISEIVGTSTLDWKNATMHLINKIAKIMGNTVEAHRNIRNSIYTDVDRRGGVSLNIRLTNLKRRMALEGASKTKIGKLNRVDVITQDKKLIEIYMAIVKEYAIKYDVWNNDFDSRKDA